MKLVQTGAYNRLQQGLVVELLKTVRGELERVETPDYLVRQLTESICFSVARLIDDVAGFEHNGEEVSPMLTFLVADDELEFAGGNSWMHEHVHGLIPGVFSSHE